MKTSPIPSDYESGRRAEKAGETQKRWQTKAWRAGWQDARKDRRDREFMAHERALAGDGCLDPACPYPSCARPGAS